MSSGTNVDFNIPQERIYFANTLNLLKRHGIEQLAKREPDMLTQDRIDASDMVIIANERAYSEAKTLVTLPEHTMVWKIVDIGEGDRIVTNDNREDLEELVYTELTSAVDELVKELQPNNSLAA